VRAEAGTAAAFGVAEGVERVAVVVERFMGACNKRLMEVDDAAKASSG